MTGDSGRPSDARREAAKTWLRENNGLTYFDDEDLTFNAVELLTALDDAVSEPTPPPESVSEAVEHALVPSVVETVEYHEYNHVGSWRGCTKEPCATLRPTIIAAVERAAGEPLTPPRDAVENIKWWLKDARAEAKTKGNTESERAYASALAWCEIAHTVKKTPDLAAGEPLTPPRDAVRDAITLQLVNDERDRAKALEGALRALVTAELHLERRVTTPRMVAALTLANDALLAESTPQPDTGET